MKLEAGRITILASEERITIEFIDNKANQIFAKATLTPAQFAAALGRLSYTECELEVFMLDRVGKKHEHKPFVFEINPEMRYSKSALNQKCLKALQAESLSEWEPDTYFGSQDSFFQKDGKQYAKTTIRRWI